MIAQVIVSIPSRQIDHPFDYLIPPELRGQVQLGSQVEVPFGRQTQRGFVVGLKTETELDPKKLRPIRGLLSQSPLDRELLELASWIASFYQSLYLDSLKLVLPSWTQKKGKTTEFFTPATSPSHEEWEQLQRRAPKQAELLAILQDKGSLPKKTLLQLGAASEGPLKGLEEKGLVRVSLKPQRRQAMAKVQGESEVRPTLTSQQERAIETLEALPGGGVGLLWGITGSGKTEVYLNLIEETLKRGQTAITLVPEIALTPQMVSRFRSRFGSQVAVLHSQLSEGERRDEWELVRTGEAQVALGPRSALFAPTENLGLIIIDEEHEPSYKQESSPRYRARDVAIKRGQLAGAKVVLGSATPSLESFYQAQAGEFQLVALTERPTGQDLPAIQLVDMRAELAEDNRSMFSLPLQEALVGSLARGEQAILFLNRRGFNTAVLCRECGQAVTCPDCNLALTYHFRQQQLRCHYCGYHRLSPKICPTCGSAKIRHFGTGTEKVEAELERLFPGVKISRMDVDTTGKKGSHEEILSAFRSGESQILIGTQMVAKGLDFPNVTMVGVVMADLTLNLPDFRASERTFQLLTQVAGRAGRGERPGEVLIQSYLPEHYSIQAAAKHDYLSFYQQELPFRRRQNYPPFVRLVNITVSGPEKQVALRVAQTLRAELSGNCQGPLPAPFPYLRGQWRYRILARFPQGEAIPGNWLKALSELNYTSSGVKVSVDVDPISML